MSGYATGRKPFAIVSTRALEKPIKKSSGARELTASGDWLIYVAPWAAVFPKAFATGGAGFWWMWGVPYLLQLRAKGISDRGSCIGPKILRNLHPGHSTLAV